MQIAVLDREALYETIERKRRREGMKKEDVAKVLGVQPCTYSVWARGGGFSADVAVRASMWCGVDLRSLVTIDPRIVEAQLKMAGEIARA